MYPCESVRIRGLLLGGFGLGVLAAEALDASGGIHQLLLAGEEWMAVGADFNTDVAPMRGAGGKRVAAGAMHTHFMVRRMNGCFHGVPNLDSDHLILPDFVKIQQRLEPLP